jgi:hypothetical protein
MRYKQYLMFFHWCFGDEIDIVFVVIQVDIDGLSRSIFKGKKKKLYKKTKMETISHKKDREIIDVFVTRWRV